MTCRSSLLEPLDQPSHKRPTHHRLALSCSSEVLTSSKSLPVHTELSYMFPTRVHKRPAHLSRGDSSGSRFCRRPTSATTVRSASVSAAAPQSASDGASCGAAPSAMSPVQFSTRRDWSVVFQHVLPLCRRN